MKEALRDRRNQLLSPDGGGQPLIVLVGPSETNIQASYVSVADILYKVDGIIEAIDLFFKSFHAFHISYPPESQHIWMTLQRGIYKFQTEWDSDCTGLESWINTYK